jgi:hypothetical protein
MAYNTFPSVTRAAAPVAANDSTQGFVVGSQWVDTSVAPRKVYLCADASVGAAVWLAAGGVTAHTALSTLGWSASGHTGTNNSIACFSNTGAALTAQATVDGTVLTFSGGTLQFLAMAAAITFLDSKTLEEQYAPAGADVIPAATALVVTGAYV